MLEQGFSNLTLKGPDITFIGGQGSTTIGNSITSLTWDLFSKNSVEFAC